jgi:hypothetical protein
MAEDQMNPPSDVLDRRIILALESAPRPVIPAGFAAMVASQAPPRPAVVLTQGHWGQRAAMACLWVLLGLMVAFAHRTAGSSVYWSWIQSIFCAQVILLAVWLVARDYISSRSF